MAMSPRLKTFLAAQHVAYEVHKHKIAYTAQEIAAAQHISGKQLAKCVLVKADQGFVLAVLPAASRVDFAKLKSALNVKKVRLAGEPDIKRLFPDANVGAMAPFGNLYEVPVVVDQTLAQAEALTCNAGSHEETMTLRYRDFERLVTPKVALFGLALAPTKKPAKAKKAGTASTTKRPPAGKKSTRSKPRKRTKSSN